MEKSAPTWVPGFASILRTALLGSSSTRERKSAPTWVPGFASILRMPLAENLNSW
jgi:hypothetical protein